MHRSPIVDEQGRLRFEYGGPDAWKQFQHRGFTVSIEWTFGDTMRRLPPVMVIWATRGRVVSATTSSDGAWAISRNDIANFYRDREDGTDEEGFKRLRITGGPSLYCMQEAHAALPILGKDPNDRHAFQALVDCVMSHGEYLGRIPPSPATEVRRRAGAPLWEVTAINKSTGKVMSEAEV